MRNISSIYIIVLLLLMNGCCTNYYNALPERPASVPGWKKSIHGDVLTIGSFVLNKGESTESEKIGVTLIDLKPATLCKGLLSEPSAAEIKLKFYRPSDRQMLCETSIFIHGTSLGGNLDCPALADLPPSIGVKSFNAKEGWVWLELGGTAGDIRW